MQSLKKLRKQSTQTNGKILLGITLEFAGEACLHCPITWTNHFVWTQDEYSFEIAGKNFHVKTLRKIRRAARTCSKRGSLNGTFTNIRQVGLISTF